MVLQLQTQGLESQLPLVGLVTLMDGTLVGTLGGIALSSNLSNYRIEQLEKKVEKHNNLVEKTYKLQQDVTVLDERIRVANHRIEDLEKEHIYEELL